MIGGLDQGKGRQLGGQPLAPERLLDDRTVEALGHQRLGEGLAQAALRPETRQRVRLAAEKHGAGLPRPRPQCEALLDGA